MGNFLMGDEGVGIHATKFLRERNLTGNVEIIDAGVPSLALLHMIEGRELVIVIDCADFGGEPGEIKAFQPDDVKRAEPERHLSLHAADLLTTFDIAAQTGLPLPPVWIVGIQPARVEPTMELSDEAATALAKLKPLIEKLIARGNSSALH
jgi:hydrogenase maturation protease